MLLYDIYRNYIYLAFSIYSTYACFFIENKLFSSQLITGYMLSDIILSSDIKKQPDMLFHHGIILCIYSIYKIYNLKEQYINIIAYHLFSLQLSSIFLSINSILVNDSLFKKINSFAFIYTFIYYRIYKFYFVLINKEIIMFIYNYNSNIMLIFYALYTLNLYWTCLIIKKMMKTIKLNIHNINVDIKTEWLLQYMLCLNIPISCYKYIQSTQNYLLLDVVGNTILAIGNYKWHNNIYLNHKYSEPLVMKPFLYDHIGIRVRVAFTLTSYCLIKNDFYNILYISIINHIGSSIVALYLTKNMSPIEFNKPSNLKLTLIMWLQFNICIEAIIISYIYNNIFNMYIILFLIGMVYKYKIFYNYSHVAFHTLLLIQNALIYSF